MVCEPDETDLDIHIPAVMLPQDAGTSLERTLLSNASGWIFKIIHEEQLLKVDWCFLLWISQFSVVQHPLPVVCLSSKISKSLSTTVSVQLYSPRRPLVDIAEVFLWLMAVGAILSASYWSAWSAREAAIEQDKLLKVISSYPLTIL